MKTLVSNLALCAGLSFGGLALADVTVQMHTVNEQGTAAAVGTVKITETQYGLVFTPDLKGLPPGIHGFHLHENPSCEPSTNDGKTTPAGAAGGHYDPHKAGKHAAPWDDGHLGDLPALYVNAEGVSSQPVLAPRLKKLSDVNDRALMLHAGGDNYSDHPEALGGGGSRIACGVVG